MSSGEESCEKPHVATDLIILPPDKVLTIFAFSLPNEIETLFLFYKNTEPRVVRNYFTRSDKIPYTTFQF